MLAQKNEVIRGFYIMQKENIFNDAKKYAIFLSNNLE